MKLKLKEKQLPAVQLRLAVPAAVSELLNHYTAYARQLSGRQVEARELAAEVLEQFITSDREFRRWLKEQPGPCFQEREAGSGKGRLANRHAAE